MLMVTGAKVLATPIITHRSTLRTPRTNLVSMTPGLRGTPVVPGVGWGPVVRPAPRPQPPVGIHHVANAEDERPRFQTASANVIDRLRRRAERVAGVDRKSTRLNSSHVAISY